MYPGLVKLWNAGKALCGGMGLGAGRWLTLGHRSETQKGGWNLTLAFSSVVPSSLQSKEAPDLNFGPAAARQ